MSFWLFAHHHETPDRAFVERLSLATKPVLGASGTPYPEEKALASVEEGLSRPDGFHFYQAHADMRRPFRMAPPTITYGYFAPPPVLVLDHRNQRVPRQFLEAGREQWIELGIVNASLDLSNEEDFNVYWQTASALLVAANADYAFAAPSRMVFAIGARDPREFAWPLMTLGTAEFHEKEDILRSLNVVRLEPLATGLTAVIIPPALSASPLRALSKVADALGLDVPKAERKAKDAAV